MAHTQATAVEFAAKVSRSKNLPWFQSKIGSSLTPAGRQLLEDYSHIDPSEVENHIFKIRDQAWEVFPWPCIGEFWFITLGLSLHPFYPSLLSRLCSPDSTTKLLDLGTCVGQDLRKLVYDGAPPDNLFGSDIFGQYEHIGHELFRDRETFHGRFITANLFDTMPEGALVKTEGNWDVINIIMFLHVFDWETQVLACKRILRLLSPKSGSMIIGAQTGSTEPGEHVLKPPFVAEGEHKSVYRQSLETFADMWRTVGEAENVQLKIEGQYDEQRDRELRAKEAEAGGKSNFFSGKHERRLFFKIEIS